MRQAGMRQAVLREAVLRDVVRRAGAAACAGVLVVLGACSAKPAPQPTDTAASERPTPSGTAAPTPKRPDPDPPVAAEPRLQPAAADLADFTCAERRTGRWVASGTITNSGDQPMLYTLTVVTVRGDTDVVGERIDDFRLAAGETVAFDWPKVTGRDADACHPRLQRTRPR
ncbi:MAG: hypothetical protein M3P83_05035 [Actinomycetota bacterium]|nr:hypothetical protein [Actinomycetota bacterium]